MTLNEHFPQSRCDKANTTNPVSCGTAANGAIPDGTTRTVSIFTKESNFTAANPLPCATSFDQKRSIEGAAVRKVCACCD